MIPRGWLLRITQPLLKTIERRSPPREIVKVRRFQRLGQPLDPDLPQAHAACKKAPI
jgi:hypothetical protein